MDILVLGAGMMGRAIAYDLQEFSHFESIGIADSEISNLNSTKKFLKGADIDYHRINVIHTEEVKRLFKKYDMVISAIPYKYNYILAKLCVETQTHFLDLGGNNDIVEQERSLHQQAKKREITIIPDCGLAPGITSVITRDIVDNFDLVESVKLRVGGLPIHPEPPLRYQIVFSPYGLINEYVEDAIVLDHGTIITKKSMTELETIMFDEPFHKMEAFLTSGGCSTLPYTYKEKIGYLDYKTIRYPGHCEKFKTMLDLGFADEDSIDVKGHPIVPRDFFASFLLSRLPINGRDVVLMKVLSKGVKKNKSIARAYTMIDYYDEEHNITSMMRTTGYPVSIIAQLIERGDIRERGVFGSEEIVPCKSFFDGLSKRNIMVERKESKT